MCDDWRKIELEIDNRVAASKAVRSNEIGETIEVYKQAASITANEWSIYLYKKSKANQLIKYIEEGEERPKPKTPQKEKREFDIWELKRLRDKGYRWKQIGDMLYSNANCTRRYFFDHKNELHETETNIQREGN
jgi:hypothetical protein